MIVAIHTRSGREIHSEAYRLDLRVRFWIPHQTDEFVETPIISLQVPQPKMGVGEESTGTRRVSKVTPRPGVQMRIRFAKIPSPSEDSLIHQQLWGRSIYDSSLTKCIKCQTDLHTF